jgi:hypothetical protein
MTLNVLQYLLQISPLEGFFFGSGKAMVVTGVALIILIGMGLWLFAMEKRIARMNEHVDELLNSQTLKKK